MDARLRWKVVRLTAQRWGAASLCGWCNRPACGGATMSEQQVESVWLSSRVIARRGSLD